MNCLGLAQIWDGNEELRNQLRDQKKMLMYATKEAFCIPNRTNAVNNAKVLEPVLRRLGEDKDRKLPHLEDLVVQVHTLFEKCGLSTADKAPYKTSVEIKKLAGFVKRKAHRKEVTLDRV